MSIVSVRQAQAPLRSQYNTNPASALVTDRAVTHSTDNSDPFHAIVVSMPGCSESLPVGVHRALGGLHDAPTPGDILCAAWASCLDSSLRMVANAMSISLMDLQVDVEGDVDVRGTLMMSREVAVGFQHMRCNIQLTVAEDTAASSVDKLCKVAEHCCVVQQTLLNAPPLTTNYKINSPETATNAS